MAHGRGQTLTTLLAYLKGELRDAQETNSPEDATYYYMLSMQQRDFCLKFDWPFLVHRWDLTCTSGSYYFNVPTSDIRSQAVSINFERAVTVERLYGGIWYPMCEGIGSEEYSVLAQGSQLDPIMRWRMDTNVNEASNPAQIEVWPTPATDQTIRFTGQRVALTLEEPTDTADLDDLLLVYWVAAQILAERGNPRAPIVLKKAQDHLVALRSSYPRNEKPILMGYKPGIYQRTQQRPILVASSPNP